MSEPDGTRPLAGFRVAELGSNAAAAWCGKLFADFGAEVVKLELPGGDPGRLVPPLIDRGDGVMESGVFAWMNTNKHSVTLPAADTASLHAILAASDILIDARPAAARDPGSTGHARLRTAFPALDIVALSWFGESGPYRDFAATDSVVRALAGLAKQTGPAAQPALQSDHQAGVPAGLAAFTAAAAALLGAAPGGRYFEISIHEANVVIAEYQAATAVQMQIGDQRQGINRWYPTFPTGIYPCREGWLGITVLTADQWRGFCHMPVSATCLICEPNSSIPRSPCRPAASRTPMLWRQYLLRSSRRARRGNGSMKACAGASHSSSCPIWRIY
jgi:crotonobetainyl-CoA:carnitine CoA-transferase CaiB-like acyl-CoA transferase